MSTIKFRMAARCEAAGRAENEDNFLLSSNLSKDNWGFDTDKEISLGKNGALIVVCDGMGGMNAGEVASALAVDTIKKWFSCDDLKNVVSSPSSIKKYIEKAIVAADTVIKEESSRDSEKAGMGSTIVLAWLVGSKVYVGWCGDSRAYRYNPVNGLVQLSKDHSYVQGLVDAGKLSEELVFDHPYSNIITRSLGDLNRTAKPGIKEYSLHNDDVIMLCSDGLSGVLRNPTIAAAIANNCETMAECRDALWESARQAGWHDNVTIALCQVTAGGKKAEAGSANEEFRPGNAKTKALITGLAAITVLLLGIVGYLLKDNILPFGKNKKEITEKIDSSLKIYEETSLHTIVFKDWAKDSTYIADNLNKTPENIRESYKKRYYSVKKNVKQQQEKFASLKKNFYESFTKNQEDNSFKEMNAELLSNSVSYDKLEKFLDGKMHKTTENAEEKGAIKSKKINFQPVEKEQTGVDSVFTYKFTVLERNTSIFDIKILVNAYYGTNFTPEQIVEQNEKKFIMWTKNNPTRTRENNAALKMEVKKPAGVMNPDPVQSNTNKPENK